MEEPSPGTETTPSWGVGAIYLVILVTVLIVSAVAGLVLLLS